VWNNINSLIVLKDSSGSNRAYKTKESSKSRSDKRAYARGVS
jgi:hypothetical protein